MSEEYRFVERVFPSHVSGVSYEGRHKHVKRLKPGDELLLVRESDNEHDDNAVQLTDKHGNALGYVPSRDNKQVAIALDYADEGLHARVIVTEVTVEEERYNRAGQVLGIGANTGVFLFSDASAEKIESLIAGLTDDLRAGGEVEFTREGEGIWTFETTMPEHEDDDHRYSSCEGAGCIMLGGVALALFLAWQFASWLFG